ncbi:hypothetical protein GCM10007415_10760 [Parapedobacter pyrenivorans]|uniref:Cytochrome c domain-containing protein n=1 Tax=Parapedobacter pyrenivorans TaxID=1305674 RepID=A0A917M617_9SPHI|nr:cytochrome c [Parapedobacter pyrenivorans]GGG80209.1 hypothetical protein GCM10007415_10760 [Parapedobacter pyrenivorans]
MKRAAKFFLYAAIALVVMITLALSYAFLGLPNVDDAPPLVVESTPEQVARGRYLAYHVMVCADCHSQRDFSVFSAPPTPGTEFVGGDVFDASMGFPGRFISPNITPHGVGDWTDGELFRLITTGVKRDGDPIFPVMPYHGYGKLDPQDIEAVIAFLRTLQPVESAHPKSTADFPMNIIMRTMPKNAEMAPKPAESDHVAYGGYLFTAAGCADCHTQFEKGAFVGPVGGGGREFKFPDGSILRAPNLTPHETGLQHFTKEAFVQRFKQYTDSAFVLPQVKPGEMQTLMPWYMYSGMTESDLGAIYDYLRTLAPYDNPVERFVSAR